MKKAKILGEPIDFDSLAVTERITEGMWVAQIAKGQKNGWGLVVRESRNGRYILAISFLYDAIRKIGANLFETKFDHGSYEKFGLHDLSRGVLIDPGTDLRCSTGFTLLTPRIVRNGDQFLSLVTLKWTELDTTELRGSIVRAEPVPSGAGFKKDLFLIILSPYDSHQKDKKVVIFDAATGKVIMEGTTAAPSAEI